MKTLLQSVSNKVTIKYVIISSLIFMLFIMFVLPYISVLSEELTSAAGSPDLLFSFSITKLHEIRMSYGVAGRRNYVFLRWTFDIVWPLVYTFFLLSSIMYFSKNRNKRIILMFVPIVAIMLDFLENILATIYMLSYPKEVILIGYSLMTVSMLKWIVLMSSFIVLIYLLFLFLLQRINERKSN